MSELHLDIGNTRTKFRVLGGNGKKISGWCSTNELCDLVGQYDVEEALISCVTATATRKRIAEDFYASGVKRIFWAESMARFGRITNAYKDHKKLGVDRWLAIIAAYNKFRKACCIFDFGSAVTVDFISGDGLHSGGFIVPGSALCFASLTQNTVALKPELYFSQSGVSGADTETCIQNGIYMQQKGFVQAVIETLRNELIVCTGGGFKQMEPVFQSRSFVFEPDLVLDGLQMVFNPEFR